MAEVTPPLYLNVSGQYGAAELALPFRDLVGQGVVGAGDLEVTAGTGLQCHIAAGAAWVTGDDDADAQGPYRVRNDGTVTLTHDAADATNPRIDRVIAEVLDSQFSGVSDLWRLRIVKGTPAGSPAAPSVPNNALSLAQVRINATATSLTSITDERTKAVVGEGAADGPTIPPAAPGVPAGALVPYAGSAAPSGYLLCDGSSYLRDSYPDLFTAIGTTYGAADGTHFNVPDMRGRMPVGVGTNSDVDALAKNEGEAVDDRRPKHKHTPATGDASGFTDGRWSGAGSTLTGYPGANLASSFLGGDHPAPVGPQANSPTDAPAYLTVNFVIKT